MVTPKRFTTMIPLISSLLLYLSSIYSLDDKREHLEAEKEQPMELILRGQICRVWSQNEIRVLNGWILLHPTASPPDRHLGRWKSGRTCRWRSTLDMGSLWTQQDSRIMTDSDWRTRGGYEWFIDDKRFHYRILKIRILYSKICIHITCCTY